VGSGSLYGIKYWAIWREKVLAQINGWEYFNVWKDLGSSLMYAIYVLFDLLLFLYYAWIMWITILLYNGVNHHKIWDGCMVVQLFDFGMVWVWTLVKPNLTLFLLKNSDDMNVKG